MTTYKELELFPDSYFDTVKPYELEDFLPHKVIEGLPKQKEREDMGVFSDFEDVEVIKLSDAFPLIIENGWRYVNTYWKGGSMRGAHKVLTFIKVS